MTETRIAEAGAIPPELADLAPYFHDIDLGGGLTTAPGSSRIADLSDLFLPPLLRLCGGSLAGKRVLDLGCNCGGLSFAAARLGAEEVVGIDARELHVRQARRVQDYLGITNVSFHQGRAEDLSPAVHGHFDVCLAVGILYHLADPIGTVRRIGEVTTGLVMVDSHVHYSAEPDLEDTPSWVMLTDTDHGDREGLREERPELSAQAYRDFEHAHPVDYGMMRRQFVPSPHSARDLAFSRVARPQAAPLPTPDSLHASEPGTLSLVPNERALTRLLRSCGFEDVLKVVPHRFSPEPYLMKYRVGLFALKREGGKS